MNILIEKIKNVVARLNRASVAIPLCRGAAVSKSESEKFTASQPAATQRRYSEMRSPVSICAYLCLSVAKLAVVLCCFVASSHATTYFVKPGGTGAGTTWETALTSVGTAITKAASGDEI